MFVGLNPSTANEAKNDPTITTVIRMANSWGYGGVYMMNLFAYVTAYPKELKQCADPIGENDQWLNEIRSKCSDVLYAYGAFKEARERAKQVVAMIGEGKALILNKDGSPHHPLRLRKDIIPVPFNLTP